mgnify:CR=1 FL=1
MNPFYLNSNRLNLMKIDEGVNWKIHAKVMQILNSKAYHKAQKCKCHLIKHSISQIQSERFMTQRFSHFCIQWVEKSKALKRRVIISYCQPPPLWSSLLLTKLQTRA